MNKDYSWQDDARKIVDECISSPVNETVGVSACVGSGKTRVAAYAIGRFVAENAGSRTFSAFVCPIIRLCDQQKNEIKSWIEKDFPQLAGSVEFRLVHCKAADGDRSRLDPRNDSPARHLVVVMCADSLWGVEQKDSKDRNRRWRRFQRYAEESGRLPGILVLDEEHNYEARGEHAEWIASKFKVLMRMSGTPSSSLKQLASERPDRMCECSFKTAVDAGLVAKPVLNVAIAGYDELPNIVSSAFDAELKKWKSGETPFKPVMLVNCGGIEHIHDLETSDALKDRIGKDFKWIAIHSTKTLLEEDSEKIVLEADVDGKAVGSDEAWAAIESVDKDGDARPVVVAQVDMIGEGVNIKSFTSAIVTTGTETSAMQQVGRVVRDCETWAEGVVKDTETVKIEKYVGGFLGMFRKKVVETETREVERAAVVRKTKIGDGQSNIYVVDENWNGIYDLFTKLGSIGLCDGAYEWGKYVAPKGSAASPGDDMPADAHGNVFGDIERRSVEIRRIEDALYKQASQQALGGIFKKGSDVDGNGVDDYDEWIALQPHLQNSGMLDVMKMRREIQSMNPPDVLVGMRLKLERWFGADPSRAEYVDKCGFGTVAAMVFGDEETGKFFDERLTDEQKSAIVGRKPADA